MTKKFTGWINFLYPPTLVLSTLMLVWFLASYLLQLPQYVLPAPQSVISRLIEEWPLLLASIAATVQVALLGLFLAVIIGLVLGTAIGWWPTARRVFLPPIVVTQSIPKIALAPLFVVWFGFDTLPKLIVVILVTFYPIVEACATGIGVMPKSIVTLARSMNLKGIPLFKKILFPAMLPYVLSAFQVSASLALIGALTAEFVGARQGVGVVLRTATGNQDTPLAFAAIIVCAVTGALIYACSVALSRTATSILERNRLQGGRQS